MRLSAGKTWTKPLAGVAIATVVALWLAPSAQAECGHYVTFNTQATAGLPMADHAAPAGPQKPVQQDVPARPKPCSGPLCSSAPAAPTAPTAPPSTNLEREPLQGLLSFSRDDRPDAVASHFEEEHTLPVRLPSSIFHPPRPF